MDRDARRGPMATPAPASKCSEPGRGPRPVRKVADAALVHRLTGVARRSPAYSWDRVNDYSKLSKHAAELGMRIGAINPKFSKRTSTASAASATRPQGTQEGEGPSAGVRGHRRRRRLAIGEPVVRRRHQLPGPGRYQGASGPLGAGMRETYDALPEGVGMLLEYNCSSPVLQHGRARLGHFVGTLPGSGPKANVLVDTGHHAPGTNIEFIVAGLLRLGRLGGFHFNSRFYAATTYWSALRIPTSCSVSSTR